MTKEDKRTLILTTAVCLIPIISGALVYNKLPDQIVTHWDASGNPNGWSSKAVGVFLLPGLMLLLNIAMPFLLKMDPKYKNISEKVKGIVLWIIPFVSLLVSVMTLSTAMGSDLKVDKIMTAFLGLLFAFIGNIMPKMSQSYTVGIRIPWTLDNEENWEKTHRIAGRIWTIGGILMIIGAFLFRSMTVLFIIILIMTVIPIIYSYGLYLKTKNNQNTESES